MKMVQTPVKNDKLSSEALIVGIIHDAMLESVTCGDTEINSANLRLVVRKMNKVDPKTNTTALQTQFKVARQ